MIYVFHEIYDNVCGICTATEQSRLALAHKCRTTEHGRRQVVDFKSRALSCCRRTRTTLCVSSAARYTKLDAKYYREATVFSRVLTTLATVDVLARISAVSVCVCVSVIRHYRIEAIRSCSECIKSIYL